MAATHTPRTFIFYLQRVTGILLLLALSAVFLFSAWSKLDTIEPFEWSFLDLAPIGLTGAGVAARLFIGLEVLIGLFLLAHLYLRAFTYRATLALLLLLTGYLLLLIVRQGNTGSCGCFGEWLYMSPLDAVWKNLAMIGAVIVLIFIYPVKPYKHQPYVAATLAVAAMVLPFVVQPVYIFGSGEKVQEPIDLTPLYTDSRPVPPVDLRKGRHIVAYLSGTCPHCKKAAYLLGILHRQHPEFPLYLVLNASKPLQDSFWKETKSAALPQSLMENTEAFSAMSGPYVPAIYWLRDGVIVRKTHYQQLEPDAIRTWLMEGAR